MLTAITARGPLSFEVSSGQDITHAIDEAAKLAEHVRAPVSLAFNGTTFLVYGTAQAAAFAALQAAKDAATKDR
jgi:hypothetical protein